MTGRYGASDISGWLTVAMIEPRMKLTANLLTRRLAVVDLAPFLGYDPDKVATQGAQAAVPQTGGTPRLLPDPFVVCATQNPVEYEGTYPLPEAQLDRFLLKLTVGLPSRDDEVEVVAAHDAGFDPRDLAAAGLRPVAGTTELAAGRAAVRAVKVSPEVLGYVVDLCRATRTSPSLSLGVSPRGATALLATSKAWAWLSGRDYLTPDDVKALARPTLRHRVSLRPEAELEGVTGDGVLDGVLSAVPVPR